MYVFSYSSKQFLTDLLRLVNAVNAEALELAHFPQHVIDAALSTYKLSSEQRESRTLNIITGFQVSLGMHVWIGEVEFCVSFVHAGINWFHYLLRRTIGSLVSL